MSEHFQYISQRDSIKSPPICADSLTTGNHTFDVGKYKHLNWKRRVLRILLGENSAPYRTYEPETFKAALDFLFTNLKTGEKARIAIGNRLSKFCNGSKDIEGFLSFEEESELLQNIAAKMGRRDQLEVVDLVGEHTELLAALEDAEKDPQTGCIILKSVFAKCPPVPEAFDGIPTALQIAQCLYEATKEVPILIEDLRNCIPESSRPDVSDGDNPLMTPADSYAMFEDAIRIRNILSGQHYQGGISRQNKYIRIIRELISGGKRYNKHPKLHPLLKILKNAEYRAFYLKDSPSHNPFAKKALAIRRATRIGVYGTALAAITGVGMTYITHLQEELRKSELRAELAERKALNNKIVKKAGLSVDPNDMALMGTFGDFKCTGADVKDRYMAWGALSNIIKYIDDELQTQYQLTPDERATILFAIKSDLVDGEVATVCDIHSDYGKLRDYLNTFMRTREKTMASHGIYPGKPYQNLDPISDLLVSSAEEWKFWDPKKDTDWEISIDDVAEEQKVGTFFTPDSSFRSHYELAVVEKDGDEVLVARHLWVCDSDPDSLYCLENEVNGSEPFDDKTFSLADGMRVAASYVVSMRRFDMAAYDKIRDVEGVNLIDKYLKVEDPRLEEIEHCVTPEGNDWLDDLRVPDYDSSIDASSYDLAVDQWFSAPKINLWGPVLIAKKPGEDCFSVSSAVEFAELYADIERLTYPKFRY